MIYVLQQATQASPIPRRRPSALTERSGELARNGQSLSKSQIQSDDAECLDKARLYKVILDDGRVTVEIQLFAVVHSWW